MKLSSPVLILAVIIFEDLPRVFDKIQVMFENHSPYFYEEIRKGVKVAV